MCPPNTTCCTFSGNTAGYDGGGMYNISCSPTVTDCVFSGNTADRGGGMYNNACIPVVTNCAFSGNSGSSYGGGMYNYRFYSTVTNCTFSENRSNSGGGMYNDDSDPAVTDCILWGNAAPGGSEVAYDNPTRPPPQISYSDVEGCGGSGAGWDPSVGADGGDNIDSNPLFVNAPLRTGLTVAGGTTTTVEITDAATNYAVDEVIELGDDGVGRTVSDVSGTMVTFAPALASASTAGMLVQNWGPGATDLDLDLHLSGGSPCIDAGTDVGAPDHDLDGNPRPSGSYYDMGAYEYW